MQPSITFNDTPTAEISAGIVIVGAGACGLVAALRAKAGGADVIVLEADAVPTGSTSMSSGFIPAPGTKFQRDIGEARDSIALFQADILKKSKGKSDPFLAKLAAETIGQAIEWLDDEHGLEWIVLDDFLYPNHFFHRMHTVPEKTGAALHGRLLAAVEACDIPVVTNARVSTLHASPTKRIEAVSFLRPDESIETVGCGALILACNGFGGNVDMVAHHIPEIAKGIYYGHAGNTGDAIVWGRALDAEIKHLSGYQGHGSVAHPHNILISWALMMEGGIQVNLDGNRFSNEHGGYSEQAVNVLSQPSSTAWNVYDQRIHEFAKSFPDYLEAIAAGAIKSAPTLADLADKIDVPLETMTKTFTEIAEYSALENEDSFGRTFHTKPLLEPPYCAVRVTGALFHTQGGMMIDEKARVLDKNNQPFPNLYAGGGAACGVSGPQVSGYLSGNGLLTAIAFGYIAGQEAANIMNARTNYH